MVESMCRRILVSLVLAAGSASAGTFALLPALAGGAVAQAVQLDAAGNIYLAGSLAPQSPKSAADSSDAFVAKLLPDGSSVVYFTILGGSGADSAVALALGTDGSATVAGLTGSSDFPVTPGALQSTSGPSFVARLDTSGAVKYATYLDTLAARIALDTSGDVFVLGSGSPGGSPLIPGGNAATAGYVVKLDPTLSKSLMSFAGLGGSAIAVDQSGYVYLTGTYPVDVTLPATLGAFQTTVPFYLCAGDNQIGFPCAYEYVAKVDPTGTKLIYLTGLNGTYGAQPAGIAADAGGNAIVAGTTNSPDFPVTPEAFESLYAPVIPPPPLIEGPFFPFIPPPATGFVAKLNATGTGLVWSTFFGGSALAAAQQYVAAGDTIASMSVDSNGNIYLAGQADSSDFPGLSGTPESCRPSVTQSLPYVARLTPDGAAASPTQLLYGMPQIFYQGNGAPYAAGTVAVAGLANGAAVSVEHNGWLAAVDLLAPSRLACIADAADNVQLLSVAPGEYVAIYGTELAKDTEQQAVGRGPLDGVNVAFGTYPSSIIYTAGNQINLQVPAGIAGSAAATMQVTSTHVPVPLDESRSLTVVPQQPGVFLAADAFSTPTPGLAYCGSSGIVGVHPTALNADGTLNTCTNRAAAGSAVTVFLNGMISGVAGAVPAPITAQVGGETEVAVAVPVTVSAEANGVLAVNVPIPLADDSSAQISLQAAGVAVREPTLVIWTRPAPADLLDPVPALGQKRVER